jgi:hypothetical protein
MTAFACIFVPDFPVEALLRAEPNLRSQALAVLEGKAPLQTIFALNEKARQAGVSAGMTKLQVEACPDLACVRDLYYRRLPPTLPCSIAPSHFHRECRMRVVTLCFSTSPAWSRFSARCRKSREMWRAVLPTWASKPTLPWPPIRTPPCSLLSAFPGWS